MSIISGGFKQYGGFIRSYNANGLCLKPIAEIISLEHYWYDNYVW
jgi:hypothetical protein